MKGLAALTDKELWKAYNHAIEINLEQEFIDQLQVELKNRQIKKGLDNRPLLKTAYA
ncbi:sporulation histidine kinase inhibitor Sda [Bacillus sp. V3B]|uniref:sporulation histidine kinase inhibitor Sda n=1 Tax=Bacillus sp. V3B TaxID=2804915 RepID=UPI00210D1C28|nr:sporulation histidine kinase inhibitor Sda [Bacillus sp. V3B]MCQ6277123.1 sporulation histidine kinase inhibitor Sda [Bacillus sp. V3B]